MTGLDIFELQQQALFKLRDYLKANPLVVGSVTIDYLFRKNSTKTKSSNYIELNVSLMNTNHGHSCRDDDILLDFDIYSTNEIMTNRILLAFMDLIERFKVDDVHYIVKPYVNGGVIPLSKNNYTQRLTAKIST